MKASTRALLVLVAVLIATVQAAQGSGQRGWAPSWPATRTSEVHVGEKVRDEGDQSKPATVTEASAAERDDIDREFRHRDAARRLTALLSLDLSSPDDVKHFITRYCFPPAFDRHRVPPFADNNDSGDIPYVDPNDSKTLDRLRVAQGLLLDVSQTVLLLGSDMAWSSLERAVSAKEVGVEPQRAEVVRLIVHYRDGIIEDASSAGDALPLRHREGIRGVVRDDRDRLVCLLEWLCLIAPEFKGLTCDFALMWVARLFDESKRPTGCKGRKVGVGTVAAAMSLEVGAFGDAPRKNRDGTVETAEEARERLAKVYNSASGVRARGRRAEHGSR